MELQQRFNLYDVVGYIIPGAVAVAALIGVCMLLDLPWPKLSWMSNTAGGVLVGLGSAYVAGHGVQNVGRFVEGVLAKWKGGWQAELMLMPEDDWYSPELKEQLLRNVTETFGLTAKPGRCSQDRKSRDEAFRLMYATVIEKDLTSHVEVFNGIRGLHRGLAAAWWIGAAAALAALIYGLLATHTGSDPWLPPPGDLANDARTRLALLGLAALSGAGFGLWCVWRMWHFGILFVDAVCRAFYVYTADKDPGTTAR